MFHSIYLPVSQPSTAQAPGGDEAIQLAALREQHRALLHSLDSVTASIAVLEKRQPATAAAGSSQGSIPTSPIYMRGTATTVYIADHPSDSDIQPC